MPPHLTSDEVEEINKAISRVIPMGVIQCLSFLSLLFNHLIRIKVQVAI